MSGPSSITKPQYVVTPSEEVASKPALPLTKNAKMITALAIGILIAIFFTGVIIASICATHGVAIPVFALIATKLTSITSVSSMIGSKILYGLFFGGILNALGALAGKIYKSGETKSMEKFLLQKIFPNRAKSDLITPLSEKKLKMYKLKRHGTIFSCQSGHNFRKLDITKDWMCGPGLLNKFKSIFTFIGHMFILDPYESFKSLFNFKKYFDYKKNLEEEKKLKEGSDSANIQKLDQLFATRIDELILSKSIPTHNQYLINPELTVLDRFINMSKAALDCDKTLGDEEKNRIEKRILRLETKKLEIVKKSSQAEGFSTKIERPNTLKFQADNFFELNEKLDQINLSLEYRMQVRESVSILLTHPMMTIDDVNRVVNQLLNQLNDKNLTPSDQWKTRESCLKYAVNCYEEKERHKASVGTTAFIIYHSRTNRSPMSVDKASLPGKIARSLLTDFAICLLPGAPFAAFIWTSLAISVSKHFDKLNTRPRSPISRH
jgi:hypothetical protein